MKECYYSNLIIVGIYQKNYFNLNLILFKLKTNIKYINLTPSISRLNKNDILSLSNNNAIKHTLYR